MDVDLDTNIVAAVGAFIGDRKPGEVLHDLFHPTISRAGEALDTLASLLPTEQISAVALVGRLKLPPLPSVVILAAVLRRIRTGEAWIHYNLCKHLSPLIDAGVSEAKLPAIIHALLALEGLRDRPSAQSVPLGVLARELATFAPREAIRCGMLAARNGDPGALPFAEPAFGQLGLETIAGPATITQMLLLAKALHIRAEEIPQTTSVRDAVGLRSTLVEPPRRITFPQVRGDASHYIFAAAGKQDILPGIVVHTVQGGTFSIDAVARGLEQHYLFDQNMQCIVDLANGTVPFVAETVLEYDEPIAVLDDRFSGAMNICHFLLDRVTRIPLYEGAWSQPGKFFLVEDVPYYRDIFDRIGLSDRVIMPPSRRVSVRAPEILFSSNIAADFRHPAHCGAGWAMDYLRRALRVEERPARPGRKLMISRADAARRTILNWEEVLPVFQRHGFEVVVLGPLATEAQIALFRDAAQVVGVHGAGLTNILFAPRDCVVLEILPPLSASWSYWQLASGLGQRYAALIADDPELPRPSYTNWQHGAAHNWRDIIVPVDRLEAALAAL